MSSEELSRTLHSLAPEPPLRIDVDDVIHAASNSGRRRAGRAALVGALAVAAAVPFAAVLSQQDRASTAAVTPPERVVVDGVEFLRRERVGFFLRPGLRSGDARGLYVTLSGTNFTAGADCAVHYESVVERQDDDGVTLATWEYRPAPPPGDLACGGTGVADREVRLALREPLAARPVLIAGQARPVRLLGATPASDPTGSGLAPAAPDGMQVCLDGTCVQVGDAALRTAAAAAVNSALPVRPGGSCSDAGRTDNPARARTYVVQFQDAGESGPRLEVPLGCTPLGVIGERARFILDEGGADAVRIAFDQQISPETQCLGIGGPSGGPVTKDYVGLTLEQAERRALATDNDGIRTAGQDGTCVGIVRDHVINRVNVYLEDGVITAAKSF